MLFMKTADYHFQLPNHLIATKPLPQRSGAKLLCLERAGKTLVDQVFSSLPNLLRPGDLLVLNNTKVLRCYLKLQKVTGGKVSLLVVAKVSAYTCRGLIQANKPVHIGAVFYVLGMQVGLRVTAKEGQFFTCVVVDQVQTIDSLLADYGCMPLPPYMKREATVADQNDYQTVYAAHEGALAAPTAGLHFDQAILDALEQRGIRVAELTLHVGLGTFLPVKVDDVQAHKMHLESYSIDAHCCRAWQQTRASGGRVIAVGTTSVRALESAFKLNQLVEPVRADTDLFIYPGYSFKSIDGLITNFHLPQSTLLMLVSAWLGRERLLHAYQHAIQSGYRFYSYGDAMLLF
jgi:S-adenosylmethionine:tRNA ribosyltransferase-isomerase